MQMLYVGKNGYAALKREAKDRWEIETENIKNLLCSRIMEEEKKRDVAPFTFFIFNAKYNSNLHDVYDAIFITANSFASSPSSYQIAVNSQTQSANWEC